MDPRLLSLLAPPPSTEVEPDPIRRLRDAARALFAIQGLPTPRREDWRSTDLDRVVLPGDAEGAPPSLPVLDGAFRFVFSDGHLVPRGVRPAPLPAGVGVGTVRAAWLAGDWRALEGILSLADEDPWGFGALNALSFQDGLRIRVPAGVRVETPIHVVVTHGTGASALRNLVDLGDGASLTLVEHVVGKGGVALSNTLTRVTVGEGATFEGIRLFDEPFPALHVAALQVRQARESTVRFSSFLADSLLARQEIRVRLDGPGATCALGGLSVGRADALLDHLTHVEHAAPDGKSRQLFKTLLHDRARGVFDGRIRVRPGARRTDAFQSARNLLLSDDAVASARPQLEIRDDDVRCSHGTASGSLDEESLFYLRARGIGLADARVLLARAFAAEVVDGLPEGLLRALGRDWLDRKLGAEAT